MGHPVIFKCLDVRIRDPWKKEMSKFYFWLQSSPIWVFNPNYTTSDESFTPAQSMQADLDVSMKWIFTNEDEYKLFSGDVIHSDELQYSISSSFHLTHRLITTHKNNSRFHKFWSVAYIGGAVVLLPPLGVPGGGPAPPGKYKIKRKQI